MARKDAVEFVGNTGPGAVINQYLPQPGQYVGRRVLQVDDTPEEYWLTAASELGTPWGEALGGAMIEPGVWEIRRPERLTSTWFERRRRIPRGGSEKGLQVAQAAIERSALDTLAQQGSLRYWASRGGTTAAKTYNYDSSTGNTTPNTSSPSP